MDKIVKFMSRAESIDITEPELLEFTKDLIREGARTTDIKDMLESEVVMNEIVPYLKNLVTLTNLIPLHVKKIQSEYENISNISDITLKLEELLTVLLISSMVSEKRVKKEIVCLPTNSEAKKSEAEKIFKKLDTSRIDKDLIWTSPREVDTFLGSFNF